jgi:hypothetical protein
MRWIVENNGTQVIIDTVGNWRGWKRSAGRFTRGWFGMPRSVKAVQSILFEYDGFRRTRVGKGSGALDRASFGPQVDGSRRACPAPQCSPQHLLLNN